MYIYNTYNIYIYNEYFQGSQNNLNSDKKDDFSDLPPNQRKKKLQLKIDEINTKVRKILLNV